MPSAMFPPTPELPGSSSVPPSAPSSRPGSVASISSFSISSISSSTSVPPSTTVSPAPASWDPDAAYETYRAKVQSATCARDFHEIMDSLIETGAHNYYDSLAIATLVTRVEALIEAHIPGGGGGQAYRADLRYRAFAAFQAHWTGDETAPWTSEPPLSPRYLSTSRGANLAAFIGSLFSVGVLTGSDVHYCLDTLVDIRDHPMYTSSPHFPNLFLAAYWALLDHAGPALCQGKSRKQTVAIIDWFRDERVDAVRHLGVDKLPEDHWVARFLKLVADWEAI